MTNVNDDRNCIVGWTIPLRLHVAHLLTRQVAYSQFGSENRCYRPPYVVRTLISKVWPTVCCGSVLLYPIRHTYSVLTCSRGLAHGPHQRKLPITLQALLHIHISTSLKHRKIKSTPSVKPAFRHPSFSPSHSASLSIYFHQSRRK